MHMPSFSVKALIQFFFKDLDLPKGFAVPSRSRYLAKDRHTQRSSTTTHYHDGDYSIATDILNECLVPSPTPHSNSSPVHPGSVTRDPGLEVSINISSTRSSRLYSFARTASDMAQTFLPLVQGMTVAIPAAGPPMQAAISGLLSILQAIHVRAYLFTGCILIQRLSQSSQNKADLDHLRTRLYQLSSHLCNVPTAQDRFEQCRRDSMIRILQETSAQLTRSQKHRLEYASVTQAIARCSIENRPLFSFVLLPQHRLHAFTILLY
ncbi:uncharacterized protein F5147DRAFT_198522 [Suillus discolor]|uniref:Uncharacterized protein n=1 Tax=Suillus discolor TaxID=1912936 RepID=A0A9P7FKR5_9AGAM|nr:uncharacterized protein F5147DRAFT_198522 [Suillus discolor]KAG2119130.1 hypothetical protein F5147DRAFT_198522 [Suillus discolor]